MGIPIEFNNPKIVLDNGKVVWGSECWWAPEEQVKRMVGSKTIVEIDIEAARNNASA